MPRKAVFQPARGGAVRAFLKVIEKEPDAVVFLPQIPEALLEGGFRRAVLDFLVGAKMMLSSSLLEKRPMPFAELPGEGE
jgi:hypothetical protein